MSRIQLGPLVKDFGVPVVTALTAVLAVILTFKTNDVQNDLKAREGEITLLTEQRHDRERQEAINFRIYDAVKASLEVANAKQQEVAKALVIAMADSSLREPLLRVLGEEGEAAVRQDVHRVLAAESQFSAAQSLVERPVHGMTGTPSGLVFDVFWCEGLGAEGEGRATAFASQIRERFGGTARVRMLPRSINLRPGYWVSGNEIRYDADEEPLANRLKELLDPKLPSGGPFTTRRVSSANRTPNYLSIFLCGN